MTTSRTGVPRPGAVAGVSRPCQHTRVHHEHGTYNRAQQDACRCPECTIAYRRRRKAYQAGARPVVPHLVPASRVAEHLAALRAVGLSLDDVAARSGLPRRTVARYASRRQGQVRFDRVQGILAVPVPRGGPTGSGWVDATGTRRRLRALAVMGWPLVAVARRTGLARHTLTDIRAGRVTQVRAATAALVAVWYRRLVTHPPAPSQRSPASEARTRRYGASWVGPAAWDEASIDDPAAVPDTTGTRAGLARG